MHGKKPGLSGWAAGPLAPVFVWRPGKPHLRSEARAELGLYVGPCLGTPSTHEVRHLSGAPSRNSLFVTAHVTPAPPALIPAQLLASDIITRGGAGLFGTAKTQYEQLRALFLNTPDPTGGRLVERTLALVGPLLGVPVAIIDLDSLTEVGIGEAMSGGRTVAGGSGAGDGQGATKGRGAGGPTTVSSAGAGSDSGAPGSKAAGRGMGREQGHGAGKTGAVSSKGRDSKASTPGSGGAAAHSSTGAAAAAGAVGTAPDPSLDQLLGAGAASFPRDAKLSFSIGKHMRGKQGYSGKLFKIYLKARNVGEYFDLHPGDTAQVRQNLGN